MYFKEFVMKFLYHATNVDFSRFSLDVGWRGREYGAGIYLINDIQHIKDFYDKEQKKELQTRVSVNNSAYVDLKAYKYHLLQQLDMHQNKKWRHLLSRIIDTHFQCRKKENADFFPIDNITDNMIFQTLERQGMFLQIPAEIKKKCQKLVSILNNNTYQLKKTPYPDNRRILKIALLTEEGIINGDKSLKENGYSKIEINDICQALYLDKSNLNHYIKRILAMQTFIPYTINPQQKARIQLLEKRCKTTTEINSSTIKLADKILLHWFLNVPYKKLSNQNANLYFIRQMEKSLGIIGQTITVENNKGKTNWTIITNPDVLHITAYACEKTNWEWKPVLRVATPQEKALALNIHMR